MPRKYQVEITATAERDLETIFKHIARDNLNAAIKLINEIERQVHSLEQFPRRCPVIPESKELNAEYRYILYGNYRTIFCIKEIQVIVLRIVHSAQLFDVRTMELE